MPDIDDFIEAQKEIQFAEKINSVYRAQNSVKAAVVSLIPVLGALFDKITDQTLEDYQNKKRQKFVDTILANKDLITSDMVKNVPCIINIARSIEVVDRCASDDKVVYYGNLIRNGYLSSKTQISNDEFDEYISILNELSYREMIYLNSFAEHARKSGLMSEDMPRVDKDNLKRYFAYMDKIYPQGNHEFILKRLLRTGFIIEDVPVVEHETVILGGTGNYALDKSYDNFERMVIKKFS
ncbi:MAG: hypothetical protein IJ600_11065 [Lachnospiraceae bacterium]|nr:hypothetical protein [Lachnospiraceae bacterium]